MPGFFLVFFYSLLFIQCRDKPQIVDGDNACRCKKNVAASRARYSHAWINPIFATGACG